MLPHFLGLGAMRAGSTLLYTLLREHPEIAVAPHRKEVRFFDVHWARGPAWYAQVFAECDTGAVVGEVTPSYLFDPRCAVRIRQIVPQVRMVAVLRDPVARAYSEFKHEFTERGAGGSFADFLDAHPQAVARGHYLEQLQRYDALFPREQLLVLCFEELVADPVAQIQRVYRHLGVSEGFVPPSAGQRINAARPARHPRLYRLGRRGLRRLQRHDQAWVVELLKRAGSRRLFFSEGDEGARLGQGLEGGGFPPLEEVDRLRLSAGYAGELGPLGRRLGVSLGDRWALASSHSRE